MVHPWMPVGEWVRQLLQLIRQPSAGALCCPSRCAWCWPGGDLTLSRLPSIPPLPPWPAVQPSVRGGLCIWEGLRPRQVGWPPGWLAGRWSCLKCCRWHRNAAWGNKGAASTVVVRMLGWDACQAQSWPAHAALAPLHSAHRERAERRKLQRAIRQEERGAARELRRDAGVHGGRRPTNLALHRRAWLCNNTTVVSHTLCHLLPCKLLPCKLLTHPPCSPTPPLQPSWRRRATARRQPSRPSCLPRVRVGCCTHCTMLAAAAVHVKL